MISHPTLSQAYSSSLELIDFIEAILTDARTREKRGLFGRDWCEPDDEGYALPPPGVHIVQRSGFARRVKDVIYRFEGEFGSSSPAVITVAGISGESAPEVAVRVAYRVFHVIAAASRLRKPDVGYQHEFTFLERLSPERIQKNLEQVRRSLVLYFKGWKHEQFEVLRAQVRKEAAFTARRQKRTEATQNSPVPRAAPCDLESDGSSTRIAEGKSREVVKPFWNADRRELHFRGHLCKRFRQKAPNQICVLEEFELAGWPSRLDDPLPPKRDADHRQRLADTVHDLNNELLKFELDGTGKGILWTPREDRMP